MFINITYCQTSKISCTLIGNRIVSHPDVVGASPVGAAPTTSSFLHSWLKTWLQWIGQRQLNHSLTHSLTYSLTHPGSCKCMLTRAYFPQHKYTCDKNFPLRSIPISSHECHGVSNHQQLDSLFENFFRLITKNIISLHYSVGNPMRQAIICRLELWERILVKFEAK